MNSNELDALRFPIGRFIVPESYTEQQLTSCISIISHFPNRLTTEVMDLLVPQLDTQYRPEGWTVRQVIHHCADSHVNAFIRFKLTLTEENPTIRPYFEERWAELADCKTMPIEASLQILQGVHTRWVILLDALSETDLLRTYTHPQYGRIYTLQEAIALYAWHCEHHLAHITHLKARMNWE